MSNVPNLDKSYNYQYQTNCHHTAYKLQRQWPEMDYNVGQTVTDISGRVLTCPHVFSVTVVCHNASQLSTHHNLDLSN